MSLCTKSQIFKIKQNGIRFLQLRSVFLTKFQFQSSNLYQQQGKCMGNNICMQYVNESEVGELDPVLSTFHRISEEINIREEHCLLFEKIKKKFSVIDCRKKQSMQWYETLKFNLYLYGNVQRDRPHGECFFYIKDRNIKSTPILISTQVNEHYVYSDKTLIVYQDNVLYYGSIKNSLAYLPRAQGNGTMIGKDFIYQGQFKNGYPQGYGSYRSKTEEYVGLFKNGEPCGQCIAKSSTQLFIGVILQTGQRVGYTINKNNEKTLLKEDSRDMESRISLRSHLKE